MAMQAEPLPGYQEPKRMVFCGLYPSDGQDFEELREALSKLCINDPSFDFEPETSDALGFGFRCGFLGLLAHGNHPAAARRRSGHRPGANGAQRHLRNHSSTTAKTLEVHNPQEVPDRGEIEEFRQPIVRVNFVLPTEYIGADHETLQRSPRHVRPATNICRPPARCWSTTCRWPK